MIPVLLSMEGFLSYQDQVEIDFTGFDLACITGENGAGKSSILDAITWVLFGRARRHDESLINLDSKQALVSLIFNYEGNQYRIIRTNPRGDTKQLDLFIRENPDQEGEPEWQPLTERTLRETDQKIIEILRLDYESFINASFLLQGEADHFTQQNPSARKRILSQILGLEVWEEYRKRTSQKRKEAESEISRLDGRLAEIQTELEEEENRKGQLSALEEDLNKAQKTRQDAERQLAEQQSALGFLQEQKKMVDALEKGALILAGKITQLEEKIKHRNDEKEEYQSILKNSDRINREYHDWQSAKKSLDDWEKIAEKFRESEIKRQEPLLQIAAEKARLLQEQISLETRFQEIKAELERLPELSEGLKSKRTVIKEAEEQLMIREGKIQDLETARQKQADARAENPLLYQEMKELEKRIQDLEAAEGALCPLCGQELSEKDRLALIKSLQEEGKDLGNRYRSNQATLKEADQVVMDLQLQITELSLVENTLRQAAQEADKIELQIKTLQDQKASWENTHQATLLQIQKSLEKEDYAKNARAELKSLNAELKKIGYDADEHDRTRELVNQGSRIQDQKTALDQAEAALKPLAREIKDLLAQKNEDQNELKRQQAELEDSRQALAKAEENAPDLGSVKNQLLTYKEQEKALEREVGAAQQKVAVLQTQKDRKLELEKERHTELHAVQQFKQLEAAFGKDGVPALLIEQALPNIEAKANQILDRLSGGTMSIRFLTQREYKASAREDMKETLDIQIRDQAGIRDYELYSGGESFRINFAIRLALSHVLAQRAGARLQTLVIDEGFGSQDAVGRQRLIEAINLIQDDFEKILVITHVEQIKEAFSTQLLVEKTSRGSRVTLV
jgi:exonuclease SbcC